MNARLAVVSVLSHPPAVLTEFFAALGRLGTDDAIFLFADDTGNPVSKKLLEQFASDRPASVVIPPVAATDLPVRPDQPVWRKAAMKDGLLEKALELGCSHALGWPPTSFPSSST
jgi:hypothetical protein